MRSKTERVCSVEKESVDMTKITPAHSSAGPQARSQDGIKNCARRGCTSGKCGELTLVRDAAFDAFRHRLAALDVFLRLGVAIRGALFHRGSGAHATVRFERATLIQNRFAGSFFGASEKAADHYTGRPRSDRF